MLALLAAGCSSPSRQPETKAPPAPRPPKIVHFYASPGVVTAGDSFLICYGVENARSIKLSPPVEAITPSPNRCISVKAGGATTYTLTAEGEQGTATASLTMKVQGRRAAAAAEPAGMIQLFAASATEVPAGQPVTLCYGLTGAKSARIDPQPGAVPVLEKNCLRIGPAVTTTYTLVVEAPDNRTEREQLTITVKR